MLIFRCEENKRWLIVTMWRKRKSYNIRKEIAEEIVFNPKKTYQDIADEFCMSENTVRRIAAEYCVAFCF